MECKEKDYFAALYDVARVINASLDSCRVLEEIVKSLTKAMDVKACSLSLLDPRRDKLLFGAVHGLSKGCICEDQILVKESGSDREVLKGKTIHCRDARTDKDFKRWAKAEGVRSVFAVPLMVGNKAIGVLKFYSTELLEFGEQEIKFIEAVANLSAIALENARLHEALHTNYELIVAHQYRLDDN
ncbi:MAG: GAF domain-containing protein [Desulfobacteria bacterium]|jgi:transcriptional regulator with GAF, ATPase, and Fis domain